jgi:hypothetical protein
MKQFLFTLLFALPLVVSAQRNYEDVQFPVDTLTNQDTIIQNFTFLFKRPYEYSIQVRTDSISGANAGFAYVEVSNDPASLYANKNWAILHTLVIDGPTPQIAVYEGIIRARYIRVRYITPSGTRVTTARTWATFKATNTP